MARIDVQNLTNLVTPVEVHTLETNTKIRKKNAAIRRVATGLGFAAGVAIGIGGVVIAFKNNATTNDTSENV
jgi:short-subunit dehydrogenase involved in D-alanine esterification of teichoic acids